MIEIKCPLCGKAVKGKCNKFTRYWLLFEKNICDVCDTNLLETIAKYKLNFYRTKR